MSVGRIIGVILLAGFSALVARAAFQPFTLAVSQRGWIPLECEIQSAEVTADLQSDISVRYTYQIGEVLREATRWALPSPVQPSKHDIQARVSSWTPGARVKCWRDPEDSEMVVLERESLWVGAMFLIPAFGILAIYLLVRPRKKGGPKRQSESQYRAATPNGKVSSGGSGLAVYLFFMFFVLAGLGLTYLFFGRQFLAVQLAKNWTQGECTVLSSRVGAHTSHDSKSNRTSTSYSVEVSYTFPVNGKKYSGSTYSLGDSQVTDSFSANEVVESLKEGSTVPCYYNPEDPTESAISRTMDSTVWFGLVPLVFTAAGLMGMGYTWQSNGSSTTPVVRGKRVRRASNRVVGFFTLLFAAAVWNGVVTVGGYAFFSSGGTAGWFLALLLTPFALIGVLLIAVIPLAFLQIFNPTVDFELTSNEVPFDGSFSVGWNLRGSPRRVRTLTLALELLALEGTQEAQVGEVEGATIENHTKRSPVPTSKRTAGLGRVVRRFEIVKTSNSNSIRKGSAEVRIPAYDSFAFPNNTRRIKWRLTATLDIPWYPDASEIMELEPRRDSMA